MNIACTVSILIMFWGWGDLNKFSFELTAVSSNEIPSLALGQSYKVNPGFI